MIKEIEEFHQHGRRRGGGARPGCHCVMRGGLDGGHERQRAPTACAWTMLDVHSVSCASNPSSGPGHHGTQYHGCGLSTTAEPPCHTATTAAPPHSSRSPPGTTFGTARRANLYSPSCHVPRRVGILGILERSGADAHSMHRQARLGPIGTFLDRTRQDSGNLCAALGGVWGRLEDTGVLFLGLPASQSCTRWLASIGPTLKR